MVSEHECQRALTQKQTLSGCGALQQGHRAPLEPLAQLGDALRGVGALSTMVQATELIAGQAAMGGARMVREQACQRAMTQKQTLLGRSAHLSSTSTPFSLMQLAMMMTDATPSPLPERLIFSVGFVPLSSSIGSAWPSTLPRGGFRAECQRALTQKQTLGRWFECPSILLERLQGRIAFEALCELSLIHI